MTEHEPAIHTKPLFDRSLFDDDPGEARKMLTSYWNGKIDRSSWYIGEFVVFDEFENNTRRYLETVFHAIRGDLIFEREDDPNGYHTHLPGDGWTYNVVASGRKELISRCKEEKFHDKIHRAYSDFVEYARMRALVEICPDDEIETVCEKNGGIPVRAKEIKSSSKF